MFGIRYIDKRDYIFHENKKLLPPNFIDFINFKYNDLPYPLYQMEDKLKLYDKYFLDVYYSKEENWYMFISRYDMKIKLLKRFSMNKMELLTKYKKTKNKAQPLIIEQLEYLLGINNENNK
jgi:hypothetical protein